MRWSLSSLGKSKSPTAPSVVRKKAKHRTYKESYRHHSINSKCTIKFDRYKNPNFLSIKFQGPIAQVPSLKNQKIQNTNQLRGEAKARLAIMTDLFQRACKFQTPQYSPKLAVFCLVMCAYRKNTFDEDNVATTIRDWLEPKFIRKKDRGWGVGVVPNDRMVKIYATKKTKETDNCDTTEIYIWPYDLVRNDELAFLNTMLDRITLTQL